MKSYCILFVIIVIVALLSNCNGNEQPEKEPLKEIREQLLANNSAFENQIQSLEAAVKNGSSDAELQRSFSELRRRYKQMEWAVAYFMPETVRFTNGPALDEIETEENTVLEAEGLQVLEEYFYPVVDTSQKAEIVRMLKKLSNKRLTIQTYFEAITISPAHLMDALRLQVFRITTLGITGFDTPVSGTGLLEAAWSLDALTNVLQQSKKILSHTGQVDSICTRIAAAQQMLASATDRNTFNYLHFIRTHLNKISEDILGLRIAENIPTVVVTKAVRDNAKNLFDTNSFNPDAFVPGNDHKQSNDKAELGKQLFSDPLFSGDGSRSCATCHQSSLAMSDGLRTAMAIKGDPLLRNTPSLSYSGFQHGQFWDMRRPDLESQAEDVITNKDEMHGTLSHILSKLNNDTHYLKKFRNIYRSDSIQTWQVQNVLAAYIRSLAAFSSPFDRYMRGDNTAITPHQQTGFNLFVGKAKCATCHFIPLFNGTVPPDFSKTESEVLGIATSFSNQQIDDDPGRGRFHGTITQLQRAFKTPTLRNISRTAPYMHNGGYQTLQQVMDFYNEGGGLGFGFRLNNQTLPSEKLNLTQPEMESIIDFMNALNDQ